MTPRPKAFHHLSGRHIVLVSWTKAGATRVDLTHAEAIALAEELRLLATAQGPTRVEADLADALKGDD